MANTDTKEFKSGFVTLIGRPNVGKIHSDETT